MQQRMERGECRGVFFTIFSPEVTQVAEMTPNSLPAAVVRKYAFASPSDSCGGQRVS